MIRVNGAVMAGGDDLKTVNPKAKSVAGALDSLPRSFHA